MNWKVWREGLVAAVVDATSDAAVVGLVAPSILTDVGGLKTLGLFMLFSALKSAAFYMKTHPIVAGQQ